MTSAAQRMRDGVSAFEILVGDAALADLRARLHHARFTSRSDDVPWRAGADPGYLGDLIASWAGFDWRAQERDLNALPQYETAIRGRRLHFLHFRAVASGSVDQPLAIILNHGWPSSFIEMLPLARRLADPGGYGGDPADAFDVVVPSLPGFLYSEMPAEPLTREAIANELHTLMTEILGYQRYGAFGGDIGGAATAWLGALYPEFVVGIHMIHPPAPSSFDPPPSDVEQAFLEAEQAYDEGDSGYSWIMGTRPDTIAAALIDSPVGLAAWIVDKYRDWSDCHGDLETRFDRQSLLTILTLYWMTGSIGSSFRSYYDYERNRTRPSITVPAAFTLATEPSMAHFPREMTERTCTDIRLWSEPGRGGHFLPFEEPQLMQGELTGFFRQLR
jgi:pimeloyl-ACP methyl ester carboxylesterase